MAEQPEKKEDFLSKLKNNQTLTHGLEVVRNLRVEWVSGIILLIGLILAFFYIHLGGFLVGLGVGLCFFGEIYHYFKRFKELYSAHGALKTLMLMGTVLYFLVAVPAFIIAVAIGFGLLALVRKLKKP